MLALLRSRRAGRVGTATLVVALFSSLAMPAAPEGTLPNDKDGRPLNFDFEAGSLRDWTAMGAAFEKQPIKGDTVFSRRNDMRSEHQGDFWIGTYEISGDGPQGMLTSVPFKVTQPWAAFL